MSKGSKNEKKYTKKIQNNNTNFNPYLNIQNNINTRDISQNMRNDFFMSNYYNIYPNNNDNTSIDLLNHKYIFKNNIPFPYFLPFGYNADPKYLNQLSYSNFTDCTTPDYYWNFTQHCNWNNSYLHNENIYNSKNMEHPYDFSNPQYINQGKDEKNVIIKSCKTIIIYIFLLVLIITYIFIRRRYFEKQND